MRSVPKSSLRPINRLRILKTVEERGEVTRRALSASLEIPPNTLSRLVRELLDAGLLELSEMDASASRPRGRPEFSLSLSSRTCLVGIFLTAYQQAISIGTLSGAVLAEQPIQLTDIGDPLGSMDEIARAVLDLLAQNRLSAEGVLGIAVAVAGDVDTDSGHLKDAPQMGWSDVPVARLVEAATGLPVVVEAIELAYARAEAAQCGRARGSSLLAAHVELGLEGSLFVDQHPVQSSSGALGQIAHIPVPGAAKACYCGRTGCLRTVASGWAIVDNISPTRFRTAKLREIYRQASNLRSLIDLATKEDPRTVEAFRAAGWQLGDAILTLADPLQLDLVVLCGPVGICPPYAEGFVRSIQAHGQHDGAPKVHVGTLSPAQVVNRLALEELLLSEPVSL